MIIYCTKCGINWAKLWINEDGGEEQYEYCPECVTDWYLTDGTDIVAYIKCQITGKIINPVTGFERIPERRKPVIRVKVGEPENKRRLTPSERDDIDDAAMNAYMAEWERSGDKEKAWEALREIAIQKFELQDN